MDLQRFRPRQQRGIAAIEFGLVLMLLILLIYGIATFGAMIYTQHLLTRAAEEGARVVTLFDNPTETHIRTVVIESLHAPWKNAPGLQVSAPMNTNPIVVTVSYPYRANAILAPLPFTGGWIIPETLRARAAVAKPSF